jgi:primosomal protein N'
VIVVSYYTTFAKKDISLDIASATTTTKSHPWPVFLFLLTMLITLIVGIWMVFQGEKLASNTYQIAGVIVIIVGVLVAVMWLACLRVADQWDRVLSGEARIVVGARSALFAPLDNLALVAIDEEHEWTYKQEEQQPRYHARDVAIKLAELTNSVVILGSATPDVTTYYRAQKGEFRLLRLQERISSGEPSPLPRVEVVDLRQELKEAGVTVIPMKWFV